MSEAATKLRVFTRPTGLHSRAMVRVADALEQYAPSDRVAISGSPSQNFTDLQILHVINADAIEYALNLQSRGIQYVVIQYCYHTAGGNVSDWLRVWRGARLVWSYYDLQAITRHYDFNFYWSPLGVGDVFRDRSQGVSQIERGIVLTTGYVNGPGAEAISEVWEAAERVGLPAHHVGPAAVHGMPNPTNWRAQEGVTDDALVALYRRASFVCALRHVEGFELPAAEGLCCGARPIVFDQPAMRRWYGGHAEYVQDRSGPALIDDLTQIMVAGARPVSNGERDVICERFNWSQIVGEFWERMLTV